MINIHKAPGMNYIFPTDFSFGSEIRFEISIRLPCRLATFLQKRKDQQGILSATVMCTGQSRASASMCGVLTLAHFLWPSGSSPWQSTSSAAIGNATGLHSDQHRLNVVLSAGFSVIVLMFFNQSKFYFVFQMLFIFNSTSSFLFF